MASLNNSIYFLFFAMETKLATVSVLVSPTVYVLFEKKVKVIIIIYSL